MSSGETAISPHLSFTRDSDKNKSNHNSNLSHSLIIYLGIHEEQVHIPMIKLYTRADTARVHVGLFTRLGPR